MDDETITTIPPAIDGTSHQIKSGPHQHQAVSISSSVRKLLARETWRSQQTGSRIIGPVLSSFDEGDDHSEEIEVRNFENRSLLDFDDLGTSYKSPQTHAVSVDLLGLLKMDEFNTHTNGRSTPSTFAKVQSLFTKRRDIPDPNRAISNLFGVQINPLTAPNLLDTITTDDGVELLLTTNNNSTLSKRFPSTGESDRVTGSMRSSNTFGFDTSKRVYTSANMIEDPSTPERSYTTHETKSDNALPFDTNMLQSPYENKVQFNRRTLPWDKKNIRYEKSREIFQSVDYIGGDPSFATLEADGRSSSWSRLSILLSISYGCTSFAGSAAIALVPSIAANIFQSRSEDSSVVDALASNFVSIVASNAVFSSALGKFINGPAGDIFGARRVSYIYSVFLSLSLFLLSFSDSEKPVLFYCLAIEFTQSVQWPCIAIILTAHFGESPSTEYVNSYSASPSSTTHKPKSNHQYERSVYEVSIGSRIGQLLASFTTTLLLHYYKVSWRIVCRLAAQISFISCILVYVFVYDSPTRRHHPQNPIRDFHSGSLGSFIFKSPSSYLRAIEWLLRFFSMVLVRNIFPSVRSVLSSGTFWIVALGHSGGSIVLTSSRILGSYFKDTSYGTISADQAGEFTAFLSLGIFVGLYFGGEVFSSLICDGRERKRFIQRNYLVSIAMCYVLAVLAVPLVRSSLYFPSMVTLLQIIATFLMGTGVAVQLYCIPAIVGATFGANKGLYFSYTDGVAYLVGSMVWGLVAGAVAEGNPQGAGWAFGWAAVALLVILAGWLMVEFVGRYFAQRDGMSRQQSASPTSKQPNFDALVSEEKLQSVHFEKVEMEKRATIDPQVSPIITL